MYRYLSGTTKVILQVKRISVVNSHWLYPSLMTYMLNKLLNLKEKGKYKFAPCLYPVQASQLSMSRFIVIEINIYLNFELEKNIFICLPTKQDFCAFILQLSDQSKQ